MTGIWKLTTQNLRMWGLNKYNYVNNHVERKPYIRWSFAEANNPIGMHYLQILTALTIQPLKK